MNRGSEWRRWELHLHTPFTKKADQYIGKTTDEKWDNFYTALNIVAVRLRTIILLLKKMGKSS